MSRGKVAEKDGTLTDAVAFTLEREAARLGERKKESFNRIRTKTRTRKRISRSNRKNTGSAELEKKDTKQQKRLLEILLLVTYREKRNYEDGAATQKNEHGGGNHSRSSAEREETTILHLKSTRIKGRGWTKKHLIGVNAAYVGVVE